MHQTELSPAELTSLGCNQPSCKVCTLFHSSLWFMSPGRPSQLFVAFCVPAEPRRSFTRTLFQSYGLELIWWESLFKTNQMWSLFFFLFFCSGSEWSKSHPFVLLLAFLWFCAFTGILKKKWGFGQIKKACIPNCVWHQLEPGLTWCTVNHITRFICSGAFQSHSSFRWKSPGREVAFFCDRIRHHAAKLLYSGGGARNWSVKITPWRKIAGCRPWEEDHCWTHGVASSIVFP